MSYKTLLLHVDGSDRFRNRLKAAAAIAALADAHVIGAAMTGVSRYIFQAMAADYGGADLEPHLDRQRELLHRQSESDLDRFDQWMQETGIRSCERRAIEDDSLDGLIALARCSDLTVVSRFDPGDPSGGPTDILPEAIAMSSGRPVLVIPPGGTFNPVGGTAVVAWDGSVEATRAVHHAIPLLQRADATHVIVFKPTSGREPDGGGGPGADAALFLARHGIEVDVLQDPSTADVGNALLARCAEMEASLLVMGCYGHSRFREILTGGVSRTVLRGAGLPVLLAH